MSYIDEIDNQCPIRFTSKQKQKFQAFVRREIKELPVCVIRSGDNENIVIGDVQSARVIIGAHYDTPMASLFPNMIFPTNLFARIAYNLLTMLIMVIMSLFIGFGIGNILSLEYYIVVPITFLLLSVVLYQLYPNTHNLNDNTSGIATIFNIIKTNNNLKHVAFILFDNEEKGKKGSSSISKAFGTLNTKLVINLDCVGNGDRFLFISKKDYCLEEYQKLRSLNNPTFTFMTHQEGRVSSDYLSFSYGVSCVAVNSKGPLLYVPNIHTSADNYVDDKNIEQLTDFINIFLKEISNGN